jgi:hypothetical protein
MSVTVAAPASKAAVDTRHSNTPAANPSKDPKVPGATGAYPAPSPAQIKRNNLLRPPLTALPIQRRNKSLFASFSSEKEDSFFVLCVCHFRNRAS